MPEDSILGFPEPAAASNAGGPQETPASPGLENTSSLLEPTTSITPVVRILFVTDGGGYDGSAEFNFGPLADALTASSKPFVRFDVTKETLGGRRFLPGSLDEFDELWLFGVFEVDDLDASFLSDEEREVIARFMDSGKGVFATGDHATRGGPLCGGIPRVRNMRKWLEADDPPPRNSALRHDTLVKRPGSQFYLTFNQTDDIPQVIFPTLYTSRELKTRKKYPHPLLSATDHIIGILPDHMHEGQCCVPADLDTSFELLDFIEYPKPEPGRHRQAPEIIARAILTEAHLTFNRDDFSDPSPEAVPLPFTQVSSFNLIGVYDGHVVIGAEGQELRIGRVVTDSSFHHFVDMNLAGFRNSAAEEGVKAHEDFLAYFNNIALWLAPPELQAKMRDRALLDARNSSPVLDELSAISEQFPGVLFDQLEHDVILRLGAVTRDFLTRLSSSSQPILWSLDLIRGIRDQDLPPGLPADKVRGVFLAANPWIQDPSVIGMPGLDIEPVADMVLGGTVLTLADRFGAKVVGIASEALAEATGRGAVFGVKAFISKLEGDLEALSQIDAAFQDLFL